MVLGNISSNIITTRAVSVITTATPRPTKLIISLDIFSDWVYLPSCTFSDHVIKLYTFSIKVSSSVLKMLHLVVILRDGQGEFYIYPKKPLYVKRVMGVY